MTPEARAARERKQKIFVVVGGLLLLVMMAIQLPRLLGGSGSSTAATTTVESAEPGGLVAPTGSGSPVSLVPTSGRGPSVPGKITVLEAFRAKDPFVQQVVAGDGATAVSPEPAKGGGKGSPAPGDSKGFSTGGKSPATPAVTIVSVNGARQTLEPGGTFPAADPVFVLVAEQPGAKSVVIGVVGGTYAGGSKTTKLKVGKPLTLVNTTTGAKYKISLVSVGSGEAPEQAPIPPR